MNLLDKIGQSRRFMHDALYRLREHHEEVSETRRDYCRKRFRFKETLRKLDTSKWKSALNQIPDIGAGSRCPNDHEILFPQKLFVSPEGSIYSILSCWKCFYPGKRQISGREWYEQYIGMINSLESTRFRDFLSGSL